MEKSRNLELVGASPTEWQLITPRGGLARPPPHLIGLISLRNQCNNYFDFGHPFKDFEKHPEGH